MVSNTANILWFTLCVLWSRTYRMYSHLRIFRLQYSSERICAAIVDITTIQCALYCKLSAKYSAHPPVYAMWTLVPDIYNAFTAPHIQTSIFIWTYLLLLEISRQFNERYTANFEPNTAHILPFTLSELWSQLYTKYLQRRILRLQYSSVGVCAAIADITWIQCALQCKLGAKYSAHPPVDAKVNCGTGHIQSSYRSAYLDFNIQLKVGPLLLEVSRQCNERYTASLVPITAHMLQFTLCELWSRTYW
jgi:hypothetical protein